MLAMPPAELAAVILPYFSTWKPQDEADARRKITAWLTTGSDRLRSSFFAGPRSTMDVFEKPDLRAVAEAMQRLEQACLLMRVVIGGDSTDVFVGITRLGRDALATNTVRQCLGLSDATPTP